MKKLANYLRKSLFFTIFTYRKKQKNSDSRGTYQGSYGGERSASQAGV